jgi:hypothetical protein
MVAAGVLHDKMDLIGVVRRIQNMANRMKLPSASETFRGVVRGKTITLEKESSLPEGSEVTVTLYPHGAGSAQALLAAIKTPPHCTAEDVAELERAINEGFPKPPPRKSVKKSRAKGRL